MKIVNIVTLTPRLFHNCWFCPIVGCSYFVLESHLRWPKLLIRSKKSQKRLFLALFVCFLPIFEGNFKGYKPMLTLSISLLIFGVFLKNQGLNLQHTDFSPFWKLVCPTFLHYPKNFFSTIFYKIILSVTDWLRLFYT